MALALAACGLDRNIDSKVTIHQGVYGLLVSACDSSGCQDQPAVGEMVTVYSPTQHDPAGYATAKSDGDGVFQVELPSGDYTLCTQICTPISVDGDRVRYDWTSGPGGGRWDKIQ